MSRPRKPNVKQEALALLERGLELLVTEGWARGAYARDRHRHPVNPTSPRAVRYCMAGALIRAEFELHEEPFEESGEVGIEGSDRFMLALSNLAFACSTIVLEPLLRHATAKEVPSFVRALAGPVYQLPDLANDVSGVRPRHILACYLLAIDKAQRAATRRGAHKPDRRRAKKGSSR